MKRTHTHLQIIVVWLLITAIAATSIAADTGAMPKNVRRCELTGPAGNSLTVIVPLVLERKGRQQPPATAELIAGRDLAGRQVELRHGSAAVAEGTLQRDGERAILELKFDADPTCLRPNELEVVVEGKVFGHITAPVAIVGMRGNPPLAELVAAATMPGRDLFPLVDPFGQYVHRDWPDKTHTVDDLRRVAAREARDLEAHPGPDERNPYGGWLAGPELEATGYFRTAKHAGKWWLVDPAGRLFWSHGIDCVRASSGITPISHREHYFQSLPERGSSLAQFYGGGSWAPHGFYHNRGSYRTFNFTAANLWRKYGEDWPNVYDRLAHQRLRSWGLNTIGNWSDPRICLMRKTPYVATLSSRSRPIEGSEGYWGKFPDPFDPSFRESLRQRLVAEQGRGVGDPWCIGVFVDNELGWGSETSLARAALVSPADQPAKVAVVELLRQKYATIGALNDAWETSHDSWPSLHESQQPPPEKTADDDLAALYTEITRTYFRVCREEIKRAAPQQLYLGCRFAWVNDRAARAAAEYCDVIGYNRYRDSVADFQLPEGLDKPVMIGEFHFGALDRGMLHPGLRPVKDQPARAAAYKSYVRGALENPQIVGTHWFLYGSQPTTGRGDGENYQIGFLDICDTPYWETIAACREVGDVMYAHRIGGERRGANR